MINPPSYVDKKRERRFYSTLPTCTKCLLASRTAAATDAATGAVRIEAVGATTRVGIDHGVRSVARSVLRRNDFPVTELLNHLTNVAHGCTKVLHAETCASLRCGEALAARKEVDHLTSLGNSIGHNNCPLAPIKSKEQQDPVLYDACCSQ